jgi:hypothetical protein
VDTGVDIAKELATVILLEKSLMVLEEGVIEGRKVFVNILKYIRMGASSNFGNMFSVLGASAFLPYVPMAPLQVLTNNLLYDFSQVPIPTDKRWPGGDRETTPLGDWSDYQVYPVYRSDQFDFRLYNFLRNAVPVWLLGPVACFGLPDRLVCRVADYANADNPRDSHQEDPFSSGPGQLAPHDYNGRGHLRWHVATVFATCLSIALRAFATAVLANTLRYAALLRSPYSNCENVADAQVVALNCRRVVPSSANLYNCCANNGVTLYEESCGCFR